LSEEHGELAPECAEAYVAYAEAILKRCEHVQDLVASAVVDAAEESDAESIAAAGDGGEKEEAEGGEASDAAEETDAELAWENLAAARRIYETANANALEVAHVCLLMGDASLLAAEPARAVGEYSKCLETREDFCEPHERALADAYASLANAYGFLGDEHSESTLKFRRQAVGCLDARVDHVRKEAKALKGRETNDEGQTKAQLLAEAAELESIVEELKEEVRAMAAGLIGRLSPGSLDNPASGGRSGEKRKAGGGGEGPAPKSARPGSP